MRTVHTAVALVAATMPLSAVRADIVWNEGTGGDLSGNPLAPTPVTLVPGTSSLIGTVGAADLTDWITIVVPPGMQLSSVINVSFVSTDPAGFVGFNAGATFLGSQFTPGSYLGFAHFGTNVTNGSLPPASTVGTDMLPLMANPLAAQGAIGFAPPLGPGSYTFIIQQLGAPTNYQFDFVLTPTPGAAAALGGGLLAARRRR